MKSTSTRRIAIAFVAIFLFIGTQLLWWYIFLSHQQQNAFAKTRQTWQREQHLMQMLYANASPPFRNLLTAYCQHHQPHLNCQSSMFLVKPTSLADLDRQQSRYRRMFLFEGLFFLLIVFLGHTVIWQSLRAEREFKNRQTNFLSAVSHEIRTPISTMRLLMETLQYRTLPEEKRTHYLQRLDKQLHRLQHTCEQAVAAAMLDGSKSESFGTEIDVNQEVARIVEEDRFELESKGITLTWEPLSHPAWIRADALSFDMIVRNLLDNAAKYNDKEEKQLRVVMQETGERLQLLVEDNGPGIPPEERERVFHPFYRVGQEMTRQKDGLGLGLYLVRGLCEQMGGRVRYEALPIGSRFVLEWKRSTRNTGKERRPPGETTSLDRR